MTEQRWSEAEVRGWLERPEGQLIEFKSLFDRSKGAPKALDRRKVRDFVAEYVAAFANADGGLLVLGVDDDGTPTGHAYNEEDVGKLVAVPQTRLSPAVPARFERVRLGDVELLVIDVPMAPEAVMVVGNGFPYRTGDQVVREPQEVINERKQAYRRVGFEQRLRMEASLEDLDEDLIYRTLTGVNPGGRTALQLLERYGLVEHGPGRVALSNAALLLFGRPPLTRWHPRCDIRLFRVDGTERRHGRDRNVSQLGRFELPLASLIPEAVAAIRGYVRRSEKLHSLFFRELPEYPDFAWQEAIVNAVAHRDYAVASQEIEVWLYDDRMEVHSPGVLVPPVSLEALRERRAVHASRNPMIVRVLVEAGLMREEGEGVPRMFEEMRDSFLRPPEFALADGRFIVTLRNEPIFEGPSKEWVAIVDRLGLTSGQRRVLLAHHEAFTNEDYRQLNGVDRDQAYREIQPLVARGIVLAPDSAGRGAVYRVAPDLFVARGWLEARLPRLQNAWPRRLVKNADYRQLFGVTRHAAVRELARLVEEGFLELIGERRGARYIPGSRLR